MEWNPADWPVAEKSAETSRREHLYKGAKRETTSAIGRGSFGLGTSQPAKSGDFNWR
jgi:hypothetical protein